MGEEKERESQQISADRVSGGEEECKAINVTINHPRHCAHSGNDYSRKSVAVARRDAGRDIRNLGRVRDEKEEVVSTF